MQMADGSHYWEAKAITREAPAPIKTIEPRDNLSSFRGRNAWTIILNNYRHGVPFLRGSNSHCCFATGVFEGVIDQVGGGARQKIFVAERCWFAIDIFDG
jgi:hypothetical protein